MRGFAGSSTDLCALGGGGGCPLQKAGAVRKLKVLSLSSPPPPSHVLSLCGPPLLATPFGRNTTSRLHRPARLPRPPPPSATLHKVRWPAAKADVSTGGRPGPRRMPRRRSCGCLQRSTIAEDRCTTKNLRWRCFAAASLWGSFTAKNCSLQKIARFPAAAHIRSHDLDTGESCQLVREPPGQLLTTCQCGMS